MIYNINRLFKIKNPLKNTSGIIEAPPEYLQKIQQDNKDISEFLKQKHKVYDANEAYKLEVKELEKNWQPSYEALNFLKELNEKYAGKKIKFYYTDPMLNHFSIDDPDCDHIPIYEVLCQSVELVDGETRKLPMIITKEKSYPLIDVVNIDIVENQIPTIKEVLQKAATLDSDSYELTDLAENIVDVLDDKNWAREIYKRSLEVCKESGYACVVAISIDKTLEDQEFVFEALLKAYELKKTNYDFSEILETCQDLEFSNETISNWIEEYAKVCKTSSDFLALSKISENHKSFALSKALEKATDVYECIELIESIKENEEKCDE